MVIILRSLYISRIPLLVGRGPTQITSGTIPGASKGDTRSLDKGSDEEGLWFPRYEKIVWDYELFLLVEP